MPFAHTWNALQGTLAPGTQIPIWSAARGLSDQGFTVTAVAPNHVDIEPPNAQRLPIADFQVVYNVWAGYSHGSVPRAHITHNIFTSTYVISILHWLENELGGQLP